MQVRPTRYRAASVALTAGLALASVTGLTGCGASPTTQAPAQYSAMPTEPPTASLAVAKPGTRYAAVPQYKQGE